ncbi:MAG: addiction module protein [Planctomycetaceae bacterium]|nr:addiction module protein [Planctomycetaceae bacterium]
MSVSPRDLLTQGKTLSVPERLDVIRELAASLDAEESFWLGDEWAETLDRRETSLDDGSAKCVSWEDVERRLAERIQRHVDG